MNEHLPPVRVTRARAAAKSDPKLNIATAASKAAAAKPTRVTTASKRKTRADDTNDYQEDELTRTLPQIIEPEAPKLRGRPKKAPATKLEPEIKKVPQVTSPKARGRPRKILPETTAPEPAKSPRGRAKHVEDNDAIHDEIVIAEPAKRTTRGRNAVVTKAVGPKKTVKFEEPDKENIVSHPASKGRKKAETATGLGARPVRKPASTAATTTRATRGKAKDVGNSEKPSPLSPKKVTQIATAKDDSDDELATIEKTFMKPLMKSPVKPPGSIFSNGKKISLANPTSTINRASVSQDLSASVMASPARRPPQSPFKNALKYSPQKLMLGDSIIRSPFKPSLPAPQSSDPNSESKNSLLQSPLRRPQTSPTKVTEAGSPTKAYPKAPLFENTPKATSFKISRFATPRTISRTPGRPVMGELSPVRSVSMPVSKEVQTCSLEFTGRLSSIMPREADPTFVAAEPINEEASLDIVTAEASVADSMDVDDDIRGLQEDEIIAVPSPSHMSLDHEISEQTQNPAFSLRTQDNSPFDDSDSEDELILLAPNACLTSSTPMSRTSRTPKTNLSTKRAARQSNIGFTPLARQLSDWMAASPESDHSGGESASPSPSTHKVPSEIPAATDQVSPAKSTFFDDEMLVLDELAAVEDEHIIFEDDPNFSPVELLEEDLDLAAEADELSVLEPTDLIEGDNSEGQNEQDMLEEPAGTMELAPIMHFESTTDLSDDFGNAPSETSQEYGDENDTTLPSSSTPAVQAPEFFTPKRVLTERVCHTVSKVPLKPADEDTPMQASVKKRSASISRLPVPRPSGSLGRSKTVISYSPTKSTLQPAPVQVAFDGIMTPSKPGTIDWSTVGTPARTPRRDLSPKLLNGAVVYVDVHTSEGADASVLFTELLTQMGARCVKSWNWNNNGEDNGKVGITHVVFKDGGKRTLEKARATGGVVSCVGVGWVLDCERENKWLDETPYTINTDEVPRGGHRRRKSMEPRALANLNGTLLTPSGKTPSKDLPHTKEFLNIPDSPGTAKSTRRRESAQWIRSPVWSTSSDDRLDDQTMALSPIPATPAPGTISAYGEAYLEQLNAGEQTPEGDSPYFLHKEKLVQMTAPPKQRFTSAEGTGFLSAKKDESVMMRLMAARRKSLQWAPKIGSPLKESSEWAL